MRFVLFVCKRVSRASIFGAVSLAFSRLECRQLDVTIIV